MSYNQSRISSLEGELASLDRDAATETKKESDLIAKINRAHDSAGRTSSASMVRSKLREIERYTRDLATTKKKLADISRKKAEKSKRLREHQQRQARDDEIERRKVADMQRDLIRERESYKQSWPITSRARPVMPGSIGRSEIQTLKYDFFICHASEDKEDFVRDLAESLREKQARVWYDEFTLDVGDSLRREIDRGLSASRFGIVVLSEHFFEKDWPQRELDGLVALETGNSGEKRILPIWHKVSKDEVTDYSPTLADRVALNTSMESIDGIASKLMKLIEND